MASVGADTDLATWIDKSLDYLTSNWEAVPAVASNWNEWDEDSRLDFVLEWPLREDRLHQLERWHGDGLFSEVQRQRFQELQALIERHRPTLERLLED